MSEAGSRRLTPKILAAAVQLIVCDSNSLVQTPSHRLTQRSCGSCIILSSWILSTVLNRKRATVRRQAAFFWCACDPSCSKETFHLIRNAGGRVTAETPRPTKRVSVGAEAVEDGPLCTGVERNDSTHSPFRCFFASMVVFGILPPQTHFAADLQPLCG